MQSRAARGEAYVVTSALMSTFVEWWIMPRPRRDIDRVAKILWCARLPDCGEPRERDAEPTAGGTEYVTYDDPTTGEIRIAGVGC